MGRGWELRWRKGTASEGRLGSWHLGGAGGSGEGPSESLKKNPSWQTLPASKNRPFHSEIDVGYIQISEPVFRA